MKTEHTRILRILWADNSALIQHAGLEHNTSQIRFTHSTLCRSSTESPLLRRQFSSLCCTPHTHTHALNRRHKTVQFLLSDGLIQCLLHASNLLNCSSQCWVPLECSLLVREGSGSLDVRGFAGRTNRRSCLLLQFTYIRVCLFYVSPLI